MSEIGTFTPEQARAIWQDYLRRQQLQPRVGQNYPQRRPVDEVSPHRVFVQNTSGETCPAYGCMQVTGTTTIGGRTVVTVTKPASTTGEFLFNSQFSLDDAACGWAYRFGVVIALGAPAESANALYQPTQDAWTIERGGTLFAAYGPHNAAVNGLIGRIVGSGSNLIDAIVTECIGDGFYLVELAEMGTMTVPVDGQCDICSGDCDTSFTEPVRTLPIGTGEFVTAYDPRKLPMEISGHCVVADMGYHEEDSGSGPNTIYTVIVPARSLESFNVEEWDCCDGVPTRIACQTFIGELIACYPEYSPCPSV